MSNMIAVSEKEKETVQELLTLNIPTYRQAYSDRTSWLMACFSELAYIKFNKPVTSYTDEELINLFKNYAEQEKKPNLISLCKLLDSVSYDYKLETRKLKDELTNLQARLIEPTFDRDGTQAILISTTNFITLAFRGTEKTSFKDIKYDMKANTTSCSSGGKIHSGFKEAYEKIACDIEKILASDSYRNKPLFVTGHSLGGALATIAAKRITHQGGIAGCYTYGSPRVGDDEWISTIKTPIYRLVNAADCVTMMPPSGDLVATFAWLFSFIPKWGDKIERYLRAKIGDYMHAGNMRYLTNCTKNSYGSVELLYSVSTIHRLKMIWIKKLPWHKLLADHSITIYRKKLEVIALNNNSK